MFAVPTTSLETARLLSDRSEGRKILVQRLWDAWDTSAACGGVWRAALDTLRSRIAARRWRAAERSLQARAAYSWVSVHGRWSGLPGLRYLPALLLGCGGVPAGWTECYRIPAHFAPDPVLWVPSAVAEEIGAGTDELPLIACDTYLQCNEGAVYRGATYLYGRNYDGGQVPSHESEGQRLRCAACNYVNGSALFFGQPDGFWPPDPAECGWDATQPEDPSDYVVWTDNPARFAR